MTSQARERRRQLEAAARRVAQLFGWDAAGLISLRDRSAVRP